jgi:hypothetical protein
VSDVEGKSWTVVSASTDLPAGGKQMQNFKLVSRSSFIWIGALVAVAALGACVQTKGSALVSAEPSAESELDGSSADLSDPFGGCVPRTGGETSPLVCSQGRTPCAGGSEGASCDPPGHCPSLETFHVMCEHICYVDADCPVPRTGTSRPVCQTDFHFCQLPCDDATTCPVGYTCQNTQLWFGTYSSGKPVALPQLCMQTIPLVRNSDGGF